jgi:hypothetical protein
MPASAPANGRREKCANAHHHKAGSPIAIHNGDTTDQRTQSNESNKNESSHLSLLNSEYLWWHWLQAYGDLSS